MACESRVYHRMTMATRPIRFFHRDAIGEINDARADPHRARIAARRRALHRHQGRLRRGRLRRLHGGDRRAATGDAARSSDFKAVNACIQFLPTLDGKALFTVEDLRQRRRRAASGAAGDGRMPRLAMRLLHAGLRDVAVGACTKHARRAAARCRRARRSTTRCPAICAAAPATGRSSTRRSA